MKSEICIYIYKYNIICIFIYTYYIYMLQVPVLKPPQWYGTHAAPVPPPAANRKHPPYFDWTPVKSFIFSIQQATFKSSGPLKDNYQQESSHVSIWAHKIQELHGLAWVSSFPDIPTVLDKDAMDDFARITYSIHVVLLSNHRLVVSPMWPTGGSVCATVSSSTAKNPEVQMSQAGSPFNEESRLWDTSTTSTSCGGSFWWWLNSYLAVSLAKGSTCPGTDFHQTIAAKPHPNCFVAADNGGLQQ